MLGSRFGKPGFCIMSIIKERSCKNSTKRPIKNKYGCLYLSVEIIKYPAIPFIAINSIKEKIQSGPITILGCPLLLYQKQIKLPRYLGVGFSS